MTPPLLRSHHKRRWYALALRHLRMARALLRTGLADGAVFHAYHAYECTLSAVIAESGWPVPPRRAKTLSGPKGVRIYQGPAGTFPDTGAHKARIVLFEQVADRSTAYWRRHSSLVSFLPTARNEALYYDDALDKLPHERYSRAWAAALLPDVHRFMRESWRVIR